MRGALHVVELHACLEEATDRCHVDSRQTFPASELPKSFSAVSTFRSLHTQVNTSETPKKIYARGLRSTGEPAYACKAQT